MGYLDKCENCESIRISASFGPYGFRVECQSCGTRKELDDLFEPAPVFASTYSIAAG